MSQPKHEYERRLALARCPNLSEAQLDRIFRAPAEPEPDRLVDYLGRCAQAVLLRGLASYRLGTPAGDSAAHAYDYTHRMLVRALLECGRWTE